MMLSDNFSLAELYRSDMAARRGYVMEPSEVIIVSLRRLCEDVLQPIRDLVGVPVLINSGYRDEYVNRLVGGAANSAHKFGRAADIRVAGMEAAELADIIENTNIGYDKMILEFGQWVHIQVSKQGSMARREVLTATHTDSGVKYTRGLG